MKSIVALFSRREEGVDLVRELRARVGKKHLFDWDDWSGFFKPYLQEGDCPKHAPQFRWNRGVLDAPCPFTPGKKRGDTHSVFAVIRTIKSEPLTLVRFVGMHPRDRVPRFDLGANDWNLEQEFANCGVVECRWHIVFRGVVRVRYMDSSLQMRERILAEHPEYEIPSALTVGMLQMFHYWKHGYKPRHYLNPDCWMQTADMVNGDHVVEVGFPSKEGVSISHSPLSPPPQDDTGVALELRLPQA